MRRTVIVSTMVVALIMSVVGGATANHFPLEGSDTWAANRGGFSEVSWDQDTGILTTAVHQKGWTVPTSGAGAGYTSHGLRAPDFDEPVTSISVDVYLDETWEGNAVAARLMANTTRTPRTWPIVEFTHIDGFEGFRYYESARDGDEYPRGWIAGNTLEDLGVDYGEWVTLTITANHDTHHFEYAVNGTAVGGRSYFEKDEDGNLAPGTIDYVILQTEFFANDDTRLGDLSNDNYEIQWRGLSTERIFDPETDSVADRSIDVEVTYTPDLKVDVVVDGPESLQAGEFGKYAATVMNHGVAADPDLENWNLGLEVSPMTSANELTLEFCRDATYDDATCYDVRDLDDVDLVLVDNVVQIRGSSEASIQPAFWETFYFRASFANEGSFTGMIYVLLQD